MCYHWPMMLESNPLVQKIVRLALLEDIGTGDATTELVVGPGQEARARVVAKAEGVLAGGPVARMVLREVDPHVSFEQLAPEGARVSPGNVVMKASGRARSLLLAERTLLNFVMRLSGVATAASRFAEATRGTATTVLDTRKTTPGHRVLEKYAARLGGVRNHRMGLDSGVLIKNNHIALAGGIKEAVQRAREAAPVLLRVEVEVRSMDQVRQALEAGADCLLLDHMTLEEVREAVAYCAGRAAVEVSGNMTEEATLVMAQHGVNFVSAGAITHGATWLDFAMYIEPAG